MTALAPVRPKLAQLVPLLGSNHDGEALGAARAIGRVLKGVGLDLHALARDLAEEPQPVVVYRDRPASTPSEAPTWLRLDSVARRAWLDAITKAAWPSEWERTFAIDILSHVRSNPLFRASPRQVTSLDRLFAKAFLMGVRP